MEDDLRMQVARLEERMKTMQAEYKTDVALLGKQLAEQEVRVGKQLADGQAASATRERWMVGMVATILGLIVASILSLAVPAILSHWSG